MRVLNIVEVLAHVFCYLCELFYKLTKLYPRILGVLKAIKTGLESRHKRTRLGDLFLICYKVWFDSNLMVCHFWAKQMIDLKLG